MDTPIDTKNIVNLKMDFDMWKKLLNLPKEARVVHLFYAENFDGVLIRVYFPSGPEFGLYAVRDGENLITITPLITENTQTEIHFPIQQM